LCFVPVKFTGLTLYCHSYYVIGHEADIGSKAIHTKWVKYNYWNLQWKCNCIAKYLDDYHIIIIIIIIIIINIIIIIEFLTSQL